MTAKTPRVLWSCIILLGVVGIVYPQRDCAPRTSGKNGGICNVVNCAGQFQFLDNTGACFCINQTDILGTRCNETECSNNNWICRRQPNTCNNSKYGEDCDQPCNCLEGAQCYMNGSCPDACAEGFTLAQSSDKCTECTNSTFGKDCENACHCNNEATCNISTGHCPNGCHPNYSGSDCQTVATTSVPEATTTTAASATIVPSRSNKNPSGVATTTTASPPSTTGTTPDAPDLLKTMIIPILASVGVLLFLILVILLCVFCYRQRSRKRSKAGGTAVPLNPESGFDQPEGIAPSKDLNKRDSSRPESQVSNVVKAPNGYERMPLEAPASYAVDTGDLEEKIKKERDTQEWPFKTEYDKIPEGQTAPWEFGMRKNIHRDKNRFGNIVAYDHSKAALSRRKDDASEYINSNFIDGYNHEKAFIATQGPIPTTVPDFWRMCWEHQVPIIVMVTNLVENGREKCAEYWPKLHQTMTSGDLAITARDEQVFADFIIRTFQVKQGEDVRIVKHYQFTGWPDHGVPRQATPLLTLRRRVRSEMAGKAGITGPTVVHCSAGVGRSGTFIAIDYLMNQAEAEHKIDVFECVWKMRYNRVNMVQTWDQYNFIYDALLEAVTVGQTTIPCYQFSTLYPEWLEKDPVTKVSKLEQQLRILDVVKTKYTEQDYDGGRRSENKDKNRSDAILPINFYRPFLQTRAEGGTDYINAVFLQGYFKRDAFLVTQSPLPDTRVDLWRMIYDYKCRTLISLQDYSRTEADTESGEVDESTPPAWPEEGGTMLFGPLTIQTTRVSVSKTHDCVKITEVNVKFKKDVLTIQIFSPVEFPQNELDPLPHKTLIALKEEVKKWQQRSEDRTIVVMCKYGVERSGLYCAMDYVIEMIEVERDVDVFQATRQVQTSRVSLIPNIEQYRYLYEIAEVYMEINGAYENFSN